MDNYHKHIRDGGKAKLLKFFFQEDFRQFEIPHENEDERQKRMFRESWEKVQKAKKQKLKNDNTF